MSTQLITSGIDQLVAVPGPSSGRTIRFRSSNVGLHHQLYANGRLIDWTDMPEQRSFFLDSPTEVLAICVGAVPAENRTDDLGTTPPAPSRRRHWRPRKSGPRGSPDGPSARIASALEDSATTAALPSGSGRQFSGPVPSGWRLSPSRSRRLSRKPAATRSFCERAAPTANRPRPSQSTSTPPCRASPQVG